MKDKRSDKITLFVTPYPHNGIGNFWGGSFWKDSGRHDTTEKNYNGHILKEYANVIEKISDENGIPCLNLFKDFGFDWREHTIDGCHPNEEGHILIGKAITEKLKNLF